MIKRLFDLATWNRSHSRNGASFDFVHQGTPLLLWLYSCSYPSSENHADVVTVYDKVKDEVFLYWLSKLFLSWINYLEMFLDQWQTGLFLWAHETWVIKYISWSHRTWCIAIHFTAQLQHLFWILSVYSVYKTYTLLSVSDSENVFHHCRSFSIRNNIKTICIAYILHIFCVTTVNWPFKCLLSLVGTQVLSELDIVVPLQLLIGMFSDGVNSLKELANQRKTRASDLNGNTRARRVRETAGPKLFHKKYNYYTFV